MPNFKTRVFLPVILGIAGISLNSQTPGQTSPSLSPLANTLRASNSLRCKARDIGGHPFQVGGLTLTIKEFNQSIAGQGRMTLSLENPTGRFLPFSAKDLVLVDSDGNQSVTLYQVWADLRIAPGAHLNLTITLTSVVKLPGKIYFGDNLLVEITN